MVQVKSLSLFKKIAERYLGTKIIKGYDKGESGIVVLK